MNSTNSQSRNEMNIQDVISHLETKVYLLSRYQELLQGLDVLDMEQINDIYMKDIYLRHRMYQRDLLNSFDSDNSHYDELLHCCHKLESKLDARLSFFNMNYMVEDFI